MGNIYLPTTKESILQIIDYKLTFVQNSSGQQPPSI